MVKKTLTTITSIILLILLAGITQATWCYQETANVSTTCGGLNTGTYRYNDSEWWTYAGSNPIWAFDENWASFTFTEEHGLPYPIYMEFNYTKPTYAQNALWHTYFIYSNPPAWPPTNTYNQNTTIPASCFNAYTDKIQLRYTYMKQQYANISCYNGTEHVTLFSGNSTIDYEKLYEEGVWWNISVTTVHTAKNKTGTKLKNVTWYINGTNYGTTNPLQTTDIIPNGIIYNITVIDNNNAHQTNTTIGNITIIGNTTTCYQESANVSTACGGLNTGNYRIFNTTDNPNYDWNVGNQTAAVDGNWTTYGVPQPATGAWEYNAMYYLVNYTVPNGTIGAILQGKTKLTTKNITININSTYINNSILQLYMYGAKYNDTGCGGTGCNATSNLIIIGQIMANGSSDWASYFDYNVSQADIEFYEEGIYWIFENTANYTLENNPHNLTINTINTAGNLLGNATVLINGTNYGITNPNKIDAQTFIDYPNPQIVTLNITIIDNNSIYQTKTEILNISLTDLNKTITMTANTFVINITAIDTLGNALTLPKWNVNGTNYGTTNPLQINTETYINYTHPTPINLLFSIQDLLGVYSTTNKILTISITNLTHNITMISGTAHLSIASLLGVATNVTSICGGNNITGLPMGQEYNTSEIDINISDWYVGNDESAAIKCWINILNKGDVNFTNYYEFINDGTTINDTIHLINSPDYYVYFKTIVGGEIIPNALIRAYEINTTSPSGLFEQGRFIGQRLTDKDGIASFYADKGTMLRLTIIKDGYQNLTDLIIVGDETYDITTPRTENMIPDIITPIIPISVFVQTGFRNRALNIPIQVNAYGRDYITLQTDYRISTGLTSVIVMERMQIHDVELHDFTYELQSGIDFNNAGNSNITLYIYEEDSTTPSVNLTIIYQGTPTYSIFAPDLLSGYDAKTVNALLMIFLIIMSFLASMIFKNIDMGTHTWYVGGIILAALSTSFAWVCYINVAYFGLKALRKIIGE